MTATILLLILVAALGFAAGWLAGRSKPSAALTRLETEHKASAEALRESQAALTRLETEHKATAEALRKSQAELAAAEARLETERDYSRREREAAAEALRNEFKTMAHDLAQTESGKLREMHSRQLQDLLGPLGENIERFRNQYVAGAASTEQHIRDLIEQTAKVGHEASELARALRSNTKLQGNWGEAVLNNILEASGLTPGRDYEVQARTHDGEGRELIPDVVVRFPGGRAVIVDSKVSLTAFASYAATDEPDRRKAFLKEHIESVRRHVRELSEKHYEKAVDGAIGYVLMFIPNEAAYIAAVENDPRLAADAYRQRVILLNPTNLLMALQLAYNLWQTELQTRNVKDIYDSAEKLYAKFISFAKNFTKIGESIQRLDETYRDAYKQLATGNGNIVRQLENWRKKGFNPTGKLPDSLRGEED